MREMFACLHLRVLHSVWFIARVQYEIELRIGWRSTRSEVTDYEYLVT